MQSTRMTATANGQRGIMVENVTVGNSFSVVKIVGL